MWQRQLRKIAINVLDQASKKIAESDDLAGAKATKLAKRWNKLDRDQKQEVATVVVGIVTAIASGVSAITKAESKKKRRRVVKKLGRKAVKELAVMAGDSLDDVKSAKKKLKKAKKK